MYSYSRIQLYRACPRRYRARYIDGLREPESDALRLGQEVHALIAEYLRHLTEAGLQTDVTWRPQAASSEASELLETFKAGYICQPECVAAVEERLGAGIGHTRFQGIIDLLELRDGTPVITDWKTDWQLRTESEVAHDLQLQSYAWLVREVYGYDDVVCRIHYVRHGVAREVRFDTGGINRAENEILSLIDAIERDQEFAPRPGAHCSWCPSVLSDDCPAVTSLGTRIASLEDAQRVAGEILVLEKQLKDRKRALKAWCAVEGPVTVGGQEFGHFDSRGFKVLDWPRFLAAVQLAGEDPYEYLSVDSRKLAKLLRGPMGEEVRSAGTEVVSTSFRSRKVREVG